MSEPQFHPEPPLQITEHEFPEAPDAEDLFGLPELPMVVTNLDVLGAIVEDSVERMRLAEELVGEERPDAEDSPSEDGAADEVDDDGDEDDDERPEHEEGPWANDLYDETEMDL